MKVPQYRKLIISLALPLSIGGIAGIFTAQAIPVWYATLNQPSFNPPNAVFGPVWTMLYILMGFSFYLIWIMPQSSTRRLAIMLYVIQLVLNFAWSFLFFYFHAIGVAFIEIFLLWTSILLMIILFYKIKPLAAYLNIPYLLWVSFATMLNGSYYLLN
jgi:translocator protein